MARGMRQGLRAALVRVLLAPFLLLSLLPAAAMPARTAEGTLTMVLCTDGGPVEMVLDLATGQPAGKAPQGKTGHCDWSCGQFAADLTPASPAVLAAVLHTTRLAPPAPPPVPAAAAATGLPPATGPPPAA